MVDADSKPSSSGRSDRVPPTWVGQHPHHHHRDHRHHHSHSHKKKSHSSHHHSTPKSTSKREQEVNRAIISFQDLDRQRETFEISVKLGVLVAKLDRVLRDRTKYVIRDEEQISFYRDGVRLSPWGGVGEGSKTIWYRVFSGAEDNTVRVTQSEDGRKWTLDQAFKDELAADIAAGRTVGELRAKVAAKLDIDDPNRIILRACGGIRSGPIPGNAWEARQFRKYLSTEINFRICPDERYFVFRGFDREYVFHPESRPTYHNVVGYLKRVIADMMLRVNQNDKSMFNRKTPLNPNDIKVIYGNRVKKSMTRMPWGSTAKFTVPAEVASIFEAEETWLLPATEMCDVCSDDKRVTEMPRQITAACEHKPKICKDCLQQWIQSSLDTAEWDRLKCPECPIFLEFEDVKRHASLEVFARYDRLATRAAVKDIPNFRWCLGAGCESGQIHNDACPKFKCHSCRHRHCINHNVVWHSGETCEQYDRRNKQKVKDEKASERAIKETSKKCPNCNKDVYKYTGCNHITCVCRHEWCYICFAPFQRNNHGFLYCRHKPDCTETDPFLEFVEGPRGANPGIPRVPQWRRPGFRIPPPPPNFRARMARPAAGGPEENRNNDNGNRAWPPPAPAPPPPFNAEVPRRVHEEITQFLRNARAEWPPAQPLQQPAVGAENQPRHMPVHPFFQDLATRLLNEFNDDL